MQETEKCGLGDRVIQITQPEQQRKKQAGREEDSPRDMGDDNKTINIHVTGAPKGKKKENRAVKHAKK